MTDGRLAPRAARDVRPKGRASAGGIARAVLTSYGGASMILPCQLTFRDFPPSSALSDLIQKKADKLDEFFNSITSCRVVIEAPHRHHQHGRHYHVRIDLTVPGGELVVDRDPESRKMHEDAYAAVED